jgi:hypothetical protein
VMFRDIRIDNISPDRLEPFEGSFLVSTP